MTAIRLDGEHRAIRYPNLRVKADDPTATLAVIDSQEETVATGTGSLSAQLPPDIYKLCVRVGEQVHEQLLVLAPGEVPALIRVPPLAFSSSAPLAGTARANAVQAAAAETLSRRIDRSFGAGSEIFLFARRCGRGAVVAAPGPDGVPAGATDPAAGLTITDADGVVLVDARTLGHRGDGWYAVNVAVAPGIYRVSVATQGLPYSQTVVAVRGWQTQYFLLDASMTSELDARCLDLADASLFMVEIGTGFQHAGASPRLIELARGALLDGTAMSVSDMMRLLEEKLESPMLGIYAAHLLLAQPASGPGRDLARNVVVHLQKELGSHPDLEALALALELPGSDLLRFEQPPVLRRSWALILAKSARLPDLVPPGSLLSRIGSHLVAAGTCLVWSDPGPRTVTPAPPDRASLLAAIHALEPAEVGRLTGPERALVALLRRYPEESMLECLPGRPRATLAAYDEQVVSALGLPPAAIDDLLADLLQK